MAIFCTTIHYKLSCHLWIWHFLIAVNPCWHHYSDVIMSVMASQITGVSMVYFTVCLGADQRKYQSPAALVLCEGNSPVTGEFPSQRASDAEDVFFIWWRHHDYISDTFWLTCCLWTDASIFCQFTDTLHMKKKLKVYSNLFNTLTDNFFVSKSEIYLLFVWHEYHHD